MYDFLVKFYEHAELYAVLLAWAVIPLFFYAVYLFFSTHYRMFSQELTSASVPEAKTMDGGEVQGEVRGDDAQN